MNEIQKERERIARMIEGPQMAFNPVDVGEARALASMVRELNCKEFGHTRPFEFSRRPACAYCGAEMSGFRQEEST